jgi:hypothetical protein
MKKIRKGVFETNSSSSHSVTVGEDPGYESEYYSKLKLETDNKIHIDFGEFGWEVDKYNEAYYKLQYALTMVISTECNYENILSFDDFYNMEGFKLIEEAVKNHDSNCEGILIDNPDFVKEDGYILHSGYIDHQSYEDYHSLQEFLNNYGVTIGDFIFDPHVVLHTDNDNH